MSLPAARLARAVVLAGLMTGMTAGCTSVTTVRLQPETVEVGPGMRPVAGIQSNVISAYLFFIPIPGGVDLDNVVNRLLVVTAKTMGADKITNLRFDITPEQGIWKLRKLIGFRSAQASGIAVQLTAPAPDPGADLGPEAPTQPASPDPSSPAGPPGSR